MTSELQKKLAAPFPPEDERTFTGRGNQTFTYIEDERVMDRLDDHGIPWSLEVTEVDKEIGIAKIRLTATIDGADRVFEDFGYATRQGGEVLKEAVSDGIRRVGRMIGIGRYLYTRQEKTQAPAGRPQAVAERAEDPAAAKPSQAMIRKLMAMFDEKGLKDGDQRKTATAAVTGKTSSKDLTVADVEKLFVFLAEIKPLAQA